MRMKAETYPQLLIVTKEEVPEWIVAKIDNLATIKLEETAISWSLLESERQVFFEN